MPRSFSEREEDQIRENLRKDGRKLFAAKGVLKTTVEEIAKSAAIAKGSFYKFYPSKEMLFFELLEDAQNAIRAPLLDQKRSSRQKTRAHFERLIHTLFRQICDDPLIRFMGDRRDLLAISRKVPPKILLAHQQGDQAFLRALIREWNTKAKSPQRDVVAARMTLLMLVSLKRDFVGERLFQHAADAAIESLADCFYKPTSSHHAKRKPI